MFLASSSKHGNLYIAENTYHTYYLFETVLCHVTTMSCDHYVM